MLNYHCAVSPEIRSLYFSLRNKNGELDLSGKKYQHVHRLITVASAVIDMRMTMGDCTYKNKPADYARWEKVPELVPCEPFSASNAIKGKKQLLLLH